MNADRQRQKILTTFTQLFESQQRIICAGDGAPSNVETLSQHDEEFADAVADLCLSGNENPLQRGNIFQNKAFTLVIGSMENVTGQSYVNAEAFGLLSDILAYLHGPTKPEEERRGDGKARYEMICHRERLECYYLQKLGQIIVACRLDYEFLSNTRLLAHAVEKLDGYSEMAQHTIMSVLSAIAIESRIIPYVELVSMNAFIRQDTFQEHSIHALLAFIANLLRFDECYHEVLRSVGLVGTLVALFLDQTSTVWSNAGSTQIRVEYPTSSTNIRQANDTPSDLTDVDEKLIISLLASHCHQRATRRRQNRNAMGRTDYIVLIDIMKLLADGIQSSTLLGDEAYLERTLCGLPMLECVCTLVGNASIQQEGITLWVSIIRLSLRLKHGDVILRNAVNSFLQALRYVTLAVYFPEDGEVTLAFPGDVVVLQGALVILETLLRPESASTTATQNGVYVNSNGGICFDETSAKERFFEALIDCDAILSLLGILCAVAKKWDNSVETTGTSDDAPVSYFATMLSLQSIFLLATSNSEAARRFCSFISYGSFGDLLDNILARTPYTPANNDDVSSAASLAYFCVCYCVGFALGDYELICFDKTSLTTAKQKMDHVSPGVLHYPQFFGIGIQMMSLHADKLGVDTTHQLLSVCLRISTFSGNAHHLASSNTLEVLLRSFTAKPVSARGLSKSEEGNLSQALLFENNPFYELAVALIESIAIAGVSLTAADYWIKTLMCLYRDRSLKSRKSRKRDRSSSRLVVQKPGPFQVPVGSTQPAASLLKLLVKLTSTTFERTEGAPAIEFDVSKEGFGCLQIPDINARAASTAESAPSPTPSLSTFTHNSKVWPPPDGYSVMSSMVSCYLNGILQENVKISYPSSITSNQPLSGLVGIPSQVRRCSSAKWMLGPFYLIDLPVSAPVVNAVFAAGPSYDRLYFGAAGNNEIGVTFDHLSIPNMVMLDSYMWDPVRSLIDSVDVERGGRNKFLRRSLSLASAASSTAAAIVQDIKSNANVFARIPSAAPSIHVPVPSERIVVAYSARNGVEKDMSIVPSSKLDGRPSGHLMGGTTLREAATMADAMFNIKSSGCQIAYGLLDEASTAGEVELALDLLWLSMRSNSRNLIAMENDHGYGIINYLLHEKAQFLNPKCLQVLFRIVGVDIELEKSYQRSQFVGPAQLQRDSAIRNMQALQYFILDYSLWLKVPGTDTAKMLFSTLYSCLAADTSGLLCE
ncbi:hypothetical protein ON010_g10192 [Phytophthora cinnamomi]|nr:hypothetical protein ON010_g10192 [Phytophthora cinnamomi]